MSLIDLLIFASLSATAAAAPGASSLNGDWVVDLSSEPGRSYTQPMTLNLQPGGAVTGSFYNSDI